MMIAQVEHDLWANDYVLMGLSLWMSAFEFCLINVQEIELFTSTH
jgi:hypothetical protein